MTSPQQFPTMVTHSSDLPHHSCSSTLARADATTTPPLQSSSSHLPAHAPMVVHQPTMVVAISPLFSHPSTSPPFHSGNPDCPWPALILRQSSCMWPLKSATAPPPTYSAFLLFIAPYHLGNSEPPTYHAHISPSNRLSVSHTSHKLL